jgi:hypothetical protein
MHWTPRGHEKIPTAHSDPQLPEACCLLLAKWGASPLGAVARYRSDQAQRAVRHFRPGSTAKTERT